MVSKSDKKHLHRPGLFKLPNKKHKTGQHRSKGELRDTKGDSDITFIQKN